MSVFDDNEDEQPNSSSSVASALRGGDEDEAPEETPNPVDGGTQAAQPAGQVDESAQQYLAPLPAEEDHGDPSENAGPTSTDSAASSPDTEAYMKPITPPTLASYTTPADHSGDMAAMTAQKQKEAAENTKPSTLRKIGAILAGIGETRLTGNIQQGINTARSIDNGPRAAAQARWQQQEAPIQSQLNADQAQDTATSRANTLTEQQNRLAETNYGNQIRGQQDQARAENYQAQADARRNSITSFTPDDPANPYAGGTGTTADGRTMKGVPPPDKWIANWEKNPDNVASAKANAGVKTLKALQAAGVKLTPEQSAIVASGGKVTPAVTTHISIAENPDGSARTPAGEAGRAGPGEIIAQNMQDKQAYIDSLTENKDDVKDEQGNILSPKGALVDKSGNTVSRQQFNDRIEKFRTDLNANPVMRKSGTMVDPQGNTVTNRFSRNPQTAPAAPPAQAQSPAAPQPQIAPKPPRTPAKGLPDNTAARNPRTGQVEWIVKGGQWTPAQARR